MENIDFVTKNEALNFKVISVNNYDFTQFKMYMKKTVKDEGFIKENDPVFIDVTEIKYDSDFKEKIEQIIKVFRYFKLNLIGVLNIDEKHDELIKGLKIFHYSNDFIEENKVSNLEYKNVEVDHLSHDIEELIENIAEENNEDISDSLLKNDIWDDVFKENNKVSKDEDEIVQYQKEEVENSKEEIDKGIEQEVITEVIKESIDKEDKEAQQKESNSVNSMATEPMNFGNDTLIHEQMIRGGQQIIAENKNLIVSSTVKINAELFASGNIIAMKDVEGKLYAGTHGLKESKIIVVGKMKAQLVSINGVYKVIEEDDEFYNQENISISLKNNILVFNKNK